MDTEDAQGVLREWIDFLADAIRNGVIEVGGEVKTDVTSSADRTYRVRVRSQAGDPGRAVLLGRIHTLDMPDVVMLEERAEMDVPTAG